MGSSSIKEYLPLRQENSVESLDYVEDMSKGSMTDIEYQAKAHPHQLKRPVCVNWTSWVPWLLVLCLIASNLYAWAKLKAFAKEDGIFSPAKSVIRYKDIVWTAGVEDERTPYQGRPNEENNRLWESLYQFGVDRIPISQAVQLANRTSPIQDDPGYYVVTLDVFHELHCLNMMRKRIFWNSTMPESDELTMKHMDHCIDSIRQSLMCSSDITPIPYAWHPKYQSVLPTTGVVHTCRDFEAIRDWARDRQSFKFDLKTYVEDPLGNVVHEFKEDTTQV